MEVKAQKIESGDFTSMTSYVNGKRVSTTINGAKVTSTNDDLIESMIRIYPNPSHDGFVNIDFGHITSYTKIEVTDIIGKSIFVSSTEVNSTIFNVDL